MEDKDIDFYLKLEKTLRIVPFASGLTIVFLLVNSFFQVVQAIDEATSLFTAILLIPWFVDSIYRETVHRRCFDIITRVVNSDPELLKKVIEKRK